MLFTSKAASALALATSIGHCDVVGSVMISQADEGDVGSAFLKKKIEQLIKEHRYGQLLKRRAAKAAAEDEEKDDEESVPKAEADAGLLRGAKAEVAGGGSPPVEMDAGMLAIAASHHAKIRSLQTPDGTTPSVEGACDDYKDTPYYGMCVSFCEAKDCDEHPEYQSCIKLKENWIAKTGEEALPCECITEIGVNTCVGVNACGGTTVEPGCGSCNGYYACEGAQGVIGDGSCNYIWGCYGGACQNAQATVGDGSCNGYRACMNAGFSGVDADIGDGSCNWWGACYRTTGVIGDESCNDGFYACNKASGGIGDRSCNNGDLACFETTGGVGTGSCNAQFACFGNSTYHAPGDCNTDCECCEGTASRSCASVGC